MRYSRKSVDLALESFLVQPPADLPLPPLSLQVSKPFFDSLQRWIFHGELHDPYSEFFVGLNPKLADKHFTRSRSFLGVEDGGFEDRVGGGGFGGQVESHRLWAEKYQFRKEMLPSFVSEEFGRKVSPLHRRRLRFSSGQS